MTRSKRHLQEYLPPRIESAGKVAHRLGCSEATLKVKHPKLHAIGFPERDKLLNDYDLDTIELWLGKRRVMSLGYDE